MFVFPTTVSAPRRRTTSDRAWPQAFDHLFAEAEAAPAATAPRVPALDVTETDVSYTLAFELPGLTREQLKVSVLGRRVALETTAPAATAPIEGERALYRERGKPSFARTVSLPSEVDPSTPVARFDNGVLTLTLTKKVPTGATRISIS